MDVVFDFRFIAVAWSTHPYGWLALAFFVFSFVLNLVCLGCIVHKNSGEFRNSLGGPDLRNVILTIWGFLRLLLTFTNPEMIVLWPWEMEERTDDLLFPMQELVLYSMLRVVEDMLQGILHSVYLAYVEFDLITLISVIISGIMLLYTTTLRFLEYIYWDYKPVRERQTISLTERCPPVCNGFPCVTDKCYDRGVPGLVRDLPNPRERR